MHIDRAELRRILSQASSDLLKLASYTGIAEDGGPEKMSDTALYVAVAWKMNEVAKMLTDEVIDMNSVIEEHRANTPRGAGIEIL